MAKLTFFYGTMSSGKTIDLIQTAYKYNSSGNKALIVKPKIDTKGGNYLTSRIGLEKEVDILLGNDESIFQYNSLIKNATCLLIDEAQFLTKKQILELWTITKEADLPVICYGLKKDFKGNLFEGSEALFTFADNLEKLKSVCVIEGCGQNASYNARKIEGHYIYDGPQVYIGADEAYDPLCSNHYMKLVMEPNDNEFKKIIENCHTIK